MKSLWGRWEGKILIVLAILVTIYSDAPMLEAMLRAL